ncbi:MAG: transposase [Solirubrobacteraceae bacterium]
MGLFTDLHSRISLAFLERYPSPGDARGMGAARLQGFLARERYTGSQKPAQLLAKLRRAPAARVGELELGTRRALVGSLVATIKVLNEQINSLERQIAAALREHPDGEIFTSLFRSPRSVICAAELLAEIGDCRARYPTRDTLAADAGQAAVAIESGKRKAACFRWACNKRLRGAVCTLADTTRHHNPWAQDLYATARARHDHPRAIRTLGRAWCRIVWRCWQDRTPYDPARHRALQRHITVTIPTASGPVIDQAATDRMAAGVTAINPRPRTPAGGKPQPPPQPDLSGASRRTTGLSPSEAKERSSESDLDSHAAGATTIEVQVGGHPTPRRLPALASPPAGAAWTRPTRNPPNGS